MKSAQAQILVIGLGPGDRDLLTASAQEALASGDPVVLRTERHPLYEYVCGIATRVTTLDHVYEKAEDFSEAYRLGAGELFSLARTEVRIVYATPGHPTVGEEITRILLAEAAAHGVEVRLLPAVSFLDTLFSRLALDPLDGLQLLDATTLAETAPRTATHVILAQVYNRHIASEAKLHLLQHYRPEHRAFIVRGGTDRVVEVPLAELDHKEFDHATSVYLPPGKGAREGAFVRSVDLMARLRSPGGCPWDREQDHQTLRGHLLEEAYELLEAIESEDPEELKEELGDLALQVLFHAQIASEDGHFDVHDTLDHLNRKLVQRHPHIFGEVRVDSSADVVVNWERIKRREKGRTSVLEGIPASLPALLLAYQVQSKAARVGFDWPDPSGVLAKVDEELAEMKEAIGDARALALEVGDLLFSVVNLCRHFEIDPEAVLRDTVKRFRNRFEAMERRAAERNIDLDRLSLEELDRLWEEAKQLEQSKEVT